MSDVLPQVSPGTPPANLEDYAYYSLQSTDSVGIVINPNAIPTDPDNNMVVISLLPDEPGATPVFSGRVATRQTIGTYSYTFLSTDTATEGFYHLAWTYQLSGVPDTFLIPIQIGSYNPAYDQLPQAARNIIELVWAKFADGYDSATGGPNLQSYFQSHFSRGRLAQLLNIRIATLNIQAQPVNVFSAAGPTFNGATITGPEFPYQQFSGLLISGLTIEVLRHLQRSYAEEPQAEGAQGARLTRRDYMDRWGSMLLSEEAEYKQMLDVFKIRQMFQLQPKVLVSGGVYGNFGPTRLAGSAAARPRFWSRFY